MLLIAPWMAWKFHMYGDFLPNTYYAKVYGIPSQLLSQLGWFYIFQVIYLPPFLLIALLILVYILRSKLSGARSLFYLIVISLTLLWHVVNSGGDHMPYLRFYAPIIPFLALAIYYSGGLLIERNEKYFRDFSGAMIVLLVFQLGIIDETQISRGAVSGASVASHIREHFKPGSLIAINPAGALPYYAPNFRYIDMLALNDKHIARLDLSRDQTLINWNKPTIGHLKYDGDYVISRKPDYIIFGDAWGDEKPRFLGDIDVAGLAGFTENYRRVEIYIDIKPENLQALTEAQYHNLEAKNKSPNSPRWVRGPVVSDDNKLRFIYYERVAK
jgi:hypothetical protein